MKRKVLTAFLILTTLLGIGYIEPEQEGNSQTVQAANTQSMVYLPTVIGSGSGRTYEKVYPLNAWAMVSTGADYASARQAPAESIELENIYGHVGQYAPDDFYNVYRFHHQFVVFDLAAISDDIVTDARLVIQRGFGDLPRNDHALYIRVGTWAGASPTANDWDSYGALMAQLPMTQFPAPEVQEVVIPLPTLAGKNRPNSIKMVWLTSEEVQLPFGESMPVPVFMKDMSEPWNPVPATRIELALENDQ